MLTVTDAWVEPVTVACLPHTMKILCIDDDPDDFCLLKEAARLYSPCECIHASDGTQGLIMLRASRPDLILLDNNMPMMNGYETLQHIRSDKTLDSVPIYLFSTSITALDCELFKALGITGCLVKPDSFHQLCDTVKALLDRHGS